MGPSIKDHHNLGGELSVPSGRFARGCVLIARYLARLEFWCKAISINPINIDETSFKLVLKMTIRKSAQKQAFLSSQPRGLTYLLNSSGSFFNLAL